jgi:hypothetical protein
MTEFTCLKCGRSTPTVKPSDKYQQGDRQEPVCQSCVDYPTPGPGPGDTMFKSEEYEQLEHAIRDYINSDPADEAMPSVWDVFAQVIGGYHRDRFIEAHDLDGPADKACIARLIAGYDECPHNVVEPDDDPNTPPHSPPASDHPTLWLDDGEPALYSMHVYTANIERLDSNEPPHNLWFDLFGFAQRHGLEVSIHPTSWYNVGTTVQVVFYPPERYRQSSQSSH